MTARRLLVAVALLLLLVGAFLMAHQIYVWDAGLYTLLGLAGLGYGLLRGRFSGRLWAWMRTLTPRSTGGWVRLGAFALSSLVGLVARSADPAGHGFAGPFLVWLLAGGAFAATCIAVWVRRPRREGAPFSKAEVLGLVALLVAAALVRGLALEHIPVNLGGDEGTQLRDGLALVSGGLGDPFATGWYSVPTMSFAVYGLAMRVFGATVAGGRALSAIAGTATVLTTFLLGRAVGGRRTGWVAALVVAFSAYHIHYSRLASNQIFDPLVGTLAVWLAWEALRAEAPGTVAAVAGRVRSSEAAWGLAGLVAGLGWYAYFGARWVSVLVALIVAWRALLDRAILRRHWRGLLLFGAGWLVAALPLLAWYSVHPSAFSERFSAVSIFGSGWLAREVEATGRSTTALLLQQVWRSFAAFHIQPDPTFWYRPGQPLVDFVTGALLLIGIVASVVRIRWPSRGLTLLWFVSTVTMAWVITENPPSSQRGLLLVPAVALLVAWGLEAVRSLAGLAAQVTRYAMGLVLAIIAVLNLVFYFGVYTPSGVYGNPSAEVATRFARYMLENPAPVCDPAALAAARRGGSLAPATAACPGRVYFLGPPYLYWDFGALSFMLRSIPGQDVVAGEPSPEVSGPARFVVVLERRDELAGVEAVYPGGQETTLYASDGRPLILIYDWPGR